MSDDLKDEIEALNSIYGDGTLSPAMGEAPCANIWILQLPRGDDGQADDASSLRIRFPPTYPESSSPEVLGTEHASGGRRGAGERDLRLLREAVVETWQAGAVCLFDAVEDFGRRLEEEKEREELEAADEEGVPAEKPERQQEDHLEEILAKMDTPPWTLSEPVTDMKSTFIAHVAPVTSPDQASLYIAHLLASDKRIRTATHNITAWRIRDESSGTTYQDSDDDGETAAGARVLHLMQLMGLWNAVVVVTRWYGGVKLGPRRFAVINAVARDGFVRAGMVAEKADGGRKKGK
jgi:hypothetical protein